MKTSILLKNKFMFTFNNYSYYRYNGDYRKTKTKRMYI